MDMTSDELFLAIDDYVRRAVQPLQKKIAELEGRLVIVRGIDGKEGPSGRDGRDGIDGKSIDPADVRAMVAEMVKAMPAPKDGMQGPMGESGPMGPMGPKGEAGPMGPMGPKGEAGPMGPKGDRGEMGPKGDPGESGADGMDGKDGAAGADGKDGARGIDGKDGAAGVNGRDGASILSAIIDADGALVLTASDGNKHVAGIVRGRDGINGKDGAPGLKGDAGRDAASIRPLPYIEDAKAYPAGTVAHHRGGSWFADGETLPLKGKAPQDCGWIPMAIGEASLDISLDGDGRTVIVKRTTSTGVALERRFTLPVVLDKGLYDPAAKYQRGDAVTYAGSLFIARKDGPDGAPKGSLDWRLAVKRGSDGKDAP